MGYWRGILIIVFILSFSSLASAQELLFFPLDEGIGTVVHDESVNENDGNLIGSVGLFTSFKILMERSLAKTSLLGWGCFLSIRISVAESPFIVIEKSFL